jgi:methanogen homocitrate synthase
MNDIEQGPWASEHFWTSPYNFHPDIQDQFLLPEKVEIHDCTLRDGEQTPGVVLRKEEKLEIAKMLDDLGVARIEAGMPAVSSEDAEAVKLIANAGLSAKTMVFCRAMQGDIDLAVENNAWGAIIETPSGYLRIKNQFKNWSEDDVIDRSIKAINYAKEKGLFVNYFPYDTTRSEVGFLERLIKRVTTESEPDSITVVDTTGCALPETVAFLVKFVKSITSLPVEIHTHNDLGLGTATSLSAVAAGAEVVHTCLNGLGERTGNASIDEIVVDLELLYGINTGFKLDKLYAVARRVEELTGVELAKNKAVVGKFAFAREIGLGLNMIQEAPLTVFQFLPAMVGQTPTVVLGKKSGKLSIEFKLRDMGLTASDESIQEILEQVKAIGIKKKGPVSDEEFAEIVRKIEG